MENIKILMQCIMLVASSSDFLMVLKFMKPKTAKFFIKAYLISAILTAGVTLIV